MLNWFRPWFFLYVVSSLLVVLLQYGLPTGDAKL